MRIDEGFAARELRRLSELDRVLADTSALIVLDRLGLLGAAASSLRLAAIAEVLAEWERGSQRRLELGILEALAGPDYAALPTDRKLVAQAAARGLTLASEDRRILLETENRGMANASCLFVALGLFLKGAIGEAALAEARDRLEREYRYDRRRLALFDAMAELLAKEGRLTDPRLSQDGPGPLSWPPGP